MSEITLSSDRQSADAHAPSNLWERISYNVSDTIVIAQRNLIRYVRLPQLLVFSTIQPIMFVLLFNYVFGGAIRLPAGVDNYINYLLPGILIQTVLFGASQTTVGLAQDLSAGMVERFRSLPMARSAVLAGRTLADSVRNVFVVLLMVGVGYLVGFRFQNGVLSALGAIFITVLFGFAFSWISANIGLLTRDPETADVAGFIWIFPLIFASSAFVPVETMPAWLQAFARVQPISQAVDAVRYLTLGEVASSSASSVWFTLMWAIGIFAVFMPLAVWRYRRIT